MAKPSSCPDLYDECRTISITKLKEWNYLNRNDLKTGNISWSRNNTVHSRIGILVNTISTRPFVELDYKCNDQVINYKVYLISKPTNIGKGEQWFFECPSTKKLCRKLYMISTYFLHRSAFKGALYGKQTYSKNNRDQFREFKKEFDIEDAYETTYSRYFKKSYNGKPTKRYSRICKKLSGSKIGSLDRFGI
ncbi:hypothetical protein [Segetibacter aerophilus]|uniref:Uncharacterized protein n=1 Tax=Segetibacter aerophilus TaxID=670293 RepID=A0A512BC19_9BACT|nr:hypothetical protein [Segetibacter aerophilus]GEO09506.1 hypothetical protein SAE01_20020 [Segetibacter aerophilus]